MRIKFSPYQPHCFAFGGFELQMLAAFEALQKRNVSVSKIDVWDRDDNFDILQCWGLGFANYDLVYWAKRSGKKIVSTILLDYEERISEKVKFYLSCLIYKQRFYKEIIKMLDAIVVVNNRQAEICNSLYRVKRENIYVIPNIVSEKFFNNSSSERKKEKYVLSVGNICRRKNQVALAEAAIQNDVNLILIGKVLNGEEKYASSLEAIVQRSKRVTWIKGLKENSDELIQYIKDCTVFALPSFVEQQPISLLEAAVLKKPLLIANVGYAKQKYYQNSYLIDPNSINSIREGLSKVLNNPQKYIPPYDFLAECKEDSVASAYMQLYDQLLSK